MANNWIKTKRSGDFRTISSPEYVQLERVIRKTVSNMNSDIDLVGLVFVQSLSDLPTPVSGVITLLQKTCYYFLTDIDLLGSRIVCEQDVVILGTSSENCSISSTGLALPLITTVYTLVIRHITFTASFVFDIDGFGNICALDWTGVNFLNCAVVGTIKNFSNFVYDKGAFLNSADLTFDGNADTIAINNSLLSLAGDGITIAATCIISRRFRITYSSVVVHSTFTGIKVDVLATIPVESFILDTVNFSGLGTYVTGITVTSNKSLFENCKGIANTSVNGQLYMQGNATATVIPNTTDFVKVAGITIPSPDNSKYLHSNNRLTNDAVIERRFLVMATISFTAGTNNECEFGIYDSTITGIRPDSAKATTASGGGRVESVKIMSLISHSQGDYVEVWCRNTTTTTNITVESLNVIVIES
jgi:hypothetical protein